MSIYCTLPRRYHNPVVHPPTATIHQRRNTVVSIEEARRLVDDLFNPIVDDDYDTKSNSSIDNNNFVQQNYWTLNQRIYGKHDNYNLILNQTEPNIAKVRAAQSEMCLYHLSSGSGSGSSSQFTTSHQYLNDNQRESNFNGNKTYYAIDKFEDIACRNSYNSKPDFYGGSDSAYESSPSYESLKSFVMDQSVQQKQTKRKSKYFTLPTRRSNKFNKQNDNVHDVINTKMKFAQISAPKRTPLNPSIYYHEQESDNKNDQLSTGSLALNNGLSPYNYQAFHCCCRSGCHQNRINPSANNPNVGLHCCHQMLETLWEEPNAESNGLIMNSVGRTSNKINDINNMNNMNTTRNKVSRRKSFFKFLYPKF